MRGHHLTLSFSLRDQSIMATGSSVALILSYIKIKLDDPLKIIVTDCCFQIPLLVGHISLAQKIVTSPSHLTRCDN